MDHDIFAFFDCRITAYFLHAVPHLSVILLHISFYTLVIGFSAHASLNENGLNFNDACTNCDAPWKIAQYSTRSFFSAIIEEHLCTPAIIKCSSVRLYHIAISDKKCQMNVHISEACISRNSSNNPSIICFFQRTYDTSMQ